ncbi:MAG: DNA repair protein RecO [Eubacteriales bacterium]
MAKIGETCRGVVLRATDVGDNDRLLTLLTAEHGRITVSAKGARSLKSRYMPVSQQFAYADFTFTERGGYRWLSDAALLESFFSVRRNLPTLALACYCMSVTESLALENSPDPELLRLILNTLHILCGEKYPVTHVKAVFEFAAAACGGFMPESAECGSCGTQKELAFLDTVGGVVLCRDCAKRAEEREGNNMLPAALFPVSPGMLDAVRYVTSPDTKNIFSFRLPEEEERAFCSLSEQYLLAQLDCSFKTLSFFHEVNDG